MTRNNGRADCLTEGALMSRYGFFSALIACAMVISPCCAKALETLSAPVVITHAREAIGVSTRSWYGDEANLLSTYSTTPRYFDGVNVGIEMNCTSTKAGSFTVELWRGSSRFSASRVGTASFSRQGFTKATWTNVGSGTYFFVFTNSAGTLIKCSGIAMYSW